MLIGLSALIAISFAPQVAVAAEVPAAILEAHRLQADGKTEAARDIYERVLLLRPTDTDAREGMSITSERLSLDERASGHPDLALKVLLRAQSAEPDDKRVLLDLGILEDELMLYLDAVNTLEHLETLSPIDPNAFYALARTEMSLGRLQAAETQMSAYLKVKPMDASAHYGLGRIYLQGLKFAEAETELKQSIAIQPRQSEAYYELGQVKLDENRFEEAISQFQRTLERDPKHGGALVGIGTAYFQMKHYDQAKDWLQRATNAAPEYQPGHYYLGLTLARLGDAVSSHRELDIATELAAKDSRQLATRTRIAGPDGQP